MTGVELIAAERKRQIEIEGFDHWHDDNAHEIGDLAMAGALYAIEAGQGYDPPTTIPPEGWPWHAKWWKPSANQLRNLAKGGALIAAEMDRLMRMDEQPRTDE